MSAGRTLADNPWLDKSDIQDLTAAVRALSSKLTAQDVKHQHALSRLAQADPITQMIELLKGVRADLQALRADFVRIPPPSSASVLDPAPPTSSEEGT